MKNLISKILALCTTTLLCATAFAANCDDVSILVETEYGGKATARNIVATHITDDGKLYVKFQLMENIEVLEKTIKADILNINDYAELPKAYKKDVITNDGTITARGTTYFLSIIFDNSIKTDSPLYQPVIQMYTRLLKSLREESAKQYFHTSYGNLNSEQRQIINELYPACIYVEHTTAAPPPPAF